MAAASALATEEVPGSSAADRIADSTRSRCQSKKRANPSHRRTPHPALTALSVTLPSDRYPSSSSIFPTATAEMPSRRPMSPRRAVHPGLGVGLRNVSSQSLFAARPTVVWAAANTRSRLYRSHLCLPRIEAGASGIRRRRRTMSSLQPNSAQISSVVIKMDAALLIDHSP